MKGKILWPLAISIIVVIFAVGVLSLVTNNTEEKDLDKLGLAYTTEGQAVTLVGSSANLESFPKEKVEANTTTTDPLMIDGGDTIYQAFKTEGVKEGKLCYQLKADTVTSTWNFLQMGSNDNETYFDVGSSTDEFIATTTIALSPKARSVDPGVATTTGQCRSIDVEGYAYTRILMWAENIPTDPTDGVQGWVQWIPIDERQD